MFSFKHNTTLSGIDSKISLNDVNFVSEKFFKLIYCNDTHPENMKFMSLTLEVLKFDKFKDVKDEQPLNIEAIFVTDEVLKLDKSKGIEELYP